MAPSATRRRDRPDSAARLKALTRRAYTATAGHLDLDDDAGREFDRIVSGQDAGSRTTAQGGRRSLPVRRWAVSGRAVIVVLVVAAALAGVVVARAIALGQSDAVPVPQLTAGARPHESHGPHETMPPSAAGRDPADGDAHATGPGAGAGSGPPEGPGSRVRETPADLVVHVAGAVREPGVVRLPAGARVTEAIDAAGGAVPAAELAAVNLARPVQDGEQVYVPAVGEAEPGRAAGLPGPGGAAGGGAHMPDDADVVDLNTADLAALDTLPGVGPAIAERILEWREAHGPFHSVEELLEVSGIGPATLERLRERVRV